MRVSFIVNVYLILSCKTVFNVHKQCEHFDFSKINLQFKNKNNFNFITIVCVVIIIAYQSQQETQFFRRGGRLPLSNTTLQLTHLPS